MIALLLLFLNSAQSGMISFEEILTLQLERSQVELDLSVKNLGDEEVYELKAIAIVNQRELALGSMKKMFPGESVKFSSHLQTSSGLERSGSYVVPVVLYWKDINQQSFETLTAHFVRKGELEAHSRFKIEPEEFDVSMRPGSTDLQLHIHNTSRELLELKLIPATTRGVTMSASPLSLNLQPDEQTKIKLSILVPPETYGSLSQVVIAEARWKDRIESRALKVSLKVSSEGDELPVIFTLNRIIAGLVLSIFITLLLIWRQKHL